MVEVIMWVLIYLAVGIIFDIVMEVLIHDYSPAEWPMDEDERVLVILLWPLGIIGTFLYVFFHIANRVINHSLTSILKRREGKGTYENTESGKTEIR